MVSLWAKQQIKNSYKYYFGLLSPPEQVSYKQLLLAMLEYKASCDLSERLATEAYSRVYNYLLLDNPALFYVQNVVFFYVSSKITAKINYTYSREKASEISGKLDRRIEQITSLCLSKNGFDKEQIVHDFLIKNIVYDDQFKGDIHSPHTALLQGRAVCDGFSKATKLIFDRISVKSIIVSGTSNVQYSSARDHADGHSWNIVCLDDSFYHLDVTFDANLTSDHHIRYDYFNLVDEQLQRDHAFDLPGRITICTLPNDYYTKNGLYFNSKKQLQQALRRALQNKETDFTFRLPFTKDPERTIRDINDLVQTTIQTELVCIVRKYSIYTNPQQMIIHLQFDV